MAVRLAERRLGLQPFGIHPAFDDDFRVCGNHHRHCLRFNNTDRGFDQAAGDCELVDVITQFLRGDVGNRRHPADAQGRRHSFLTRSVLFPVHVDALAQFQRRVAADPVRRLDHGAVGADVMNAAVRIFCDEMRGANVRRVIPTRGRDRHRDAIDALPGYFEIVPLIDNFMNRRGFGRNLHRRDRIGFRFGPQLVYLSWITAETDSVDCSVGC